MEPSMSLVKYTHSRREVRPRSSTVIISTPAFALFATSPSATSACRLRLAFALRPVATLPLCLTFALRRWHRPLTVAFSAATFVTAVTFPTFFSVTTASTLTIFAFTSATAASPSRSRFSRGTIEVCGGIGVRSPLCSVGSMCWSLPSSLPILLIILLITRKGWWGRSCCLSLPVIQNINLGVWRNQGLHRQPTLINDLILFVVLVAKDPATLR